MILGEKTLFLRKFFGGELRFHEIYFITKGFFVQLSIRVRTGGGGSEEDGGRGWRLRLSNAIAHAMFQHDLGC